MPSGRRLRSHRTMSALSVPPQWQKRHDAANARHTAGIDKSLDDCAAARRIEYGRFTGKSSRTIFLARSQITGSSDARNFSAAIGSRPKSKRLAAGLFPQTKDFGNSPNMRQPHSRVPAPDQYRVAANFFLRERLFDFPSFSTRQKENVNGKCSFFLLRAQRWRTNFVFRSVNPLGTPCWSQQTFAFKLGNCNEIIQLLD